MENCYPYRQLYSYLMKCEYILYSKKLQIFCFHLLTYFTKLCCQKHKYHFSVTNMLTFVNIVYFFSYKYIHSLWYPKFVWILLRHVLAFWIWYSLVRISWTNIFVKDLIVWDDVSMKNITLVLVKCISKYQCIHVFKLLWKVSSKRQFTLEKLWDYQIIPIFLKQAFNHLFNRYAFK